MTKQMESLVQARAQELADLDDTAVSTIYVVAAVNALQVDLLAARDRLLQPGAEIIVDPAPPPSPLSEGSPPALEPATPGAPEPATEEAAEAPAAEEVAPVDTEETVPADAAEPVDGEAPAA